MGKACTCIVAFEETFLTVVLEKVVEGSNQGSDGVVYMYYSHAHLIEPPTRMVSQVSPLLEVIYSIQANHLFTQIF